MSFAWTFTTRGAVSVKVASAPLYTADPPAMVTTGTVDGDCAAAGMEAPNNSVSSGARNNPRQGANARSP
ncbi:MAG: hypothetical protein F4Z73_04870 [Synechococcus sp. SB0668_bin_13]|nr:hypothetical protein [Synechococcus sp. SB0668_bin_13]